MTEKQIMHDRKICESLKKLFIANTVLTPIGFFLFGIAFIMSLTNSIANPGIAATLFLPIIPLGIATFVINIVYAIKLLTAKFNEPTLDQEKIIWGIFTIFLLGWIAMLVWTLRSQNLLNAASIKENVESDDYQ